MSVLFSYLLSVGMSASALVLQQPPDAAKSGTVEKSLAESQSFSEVSPEKPKRSVDLEQNRPEMKSSDDSKVRFRVERIKVTGNSSVSDYDIYSVIAGDRGVIGAVMSLAEIKAEAQRITKLYRSRGFVVSWAYVPAQEVKDGVVEIAVSEGRVEKILVAGGRVAYLGG